MTQHIDQQPRTLSAWLSYLEHIHSTTIDMGLERTLRVAEQMQIQKPAPFIFMVGGTNGKGSTVSMLEHILKASGKRVATYTSPHLVDYRERVRVDGALLSEQEHCEAFAAVDAARKQTSLTYFEFGTLAAFWLIKKAQVDIAILEVGLGGRLDAVNVAEPDVSIVTSVDIDHIQFLGDDREHIGFEKAGIFRANKPAICGDSNAPQKLIEHARQIGALLRCVGRDFNAIQAASHWSYEDASSFSEWQHLNYPQLPFPNAITALAALKASPFELTQDHVNQGLRDARVAGRFDLWEGEPRIVVDVAHNPHAARYLAERLAEIVNGGRVLAVCGMLIDKDIKATLHAMNDVVDSWYLASLHTSRGASAQQLAKAIDDAPHEDFPSVGEALKAAKCAASEVDVIVCFGSFITVAEVYQTEGRSIGVE